MIFPISEASPIRFAGELPRRVDTIVIGGGVIGVMTALALRESGQKVLVLEKGRIAGEQSSRNWGWIRQQGRDPAELPIAMDSARLWQALPQKLRERIGYAQKGVLYLAGREEDLAGYEAWLASVKGSGVDSLMLSAREVAERIPAAQAGWKGGLFTASDARAEPALAVPLLAEYAAEAGVIIRENCAARCLELTDGMLTGVVTEAGRLSCDQVVVAAGAWSRLFLRPAGVKLPQLAVRASVAATVPLPEVFAGNAVDSHFAFRRRLDGGYTLAPADHHDFYIGPDACTSFLTYLPLLKTTFANTRLQPWAPRGFPDSWLGERAVNSDQISPFERMRVLNPAPSAKAIARLQDRFAAAFPGIGRPGLKQSWAGMIDTMPDVVPVIDRAAAIPGLIIATGFSGHGFGIGPGVAQVIADLTLGRPARHDLSRFRLSRFSDGSKLQPGPAL